MAPGVSVYLQSPNSSIWTINGVISSWTDDTCEVKVIYRGERLPIANSTQVDLVTTRMDGVFSVSSCVSGIFVEALPPETELEDEETANPVYECTVQLTVDFSGARRMQQRAFFRLAGKWNAHVCYPIQRVEEENIYHQALVRNLSASGLLLEDGRGVLELERRFRVLLDLKDNQPPIRIEALVVRKDEHYLGVNPLWGCKFVQIADEDEVRIVRSLHIQLRNRCSISTSA